MKKMIRLNGFKIAKVLFVIIIILIIISPLVENYKNSPKVEYASVTSSVLISAIEEDTVEKVTIKSDDVFFTVDGKYFVVLNQAPAFRNLLILEGLISEEYAKTELEPLLPAIIRTVFIYIVSISIIIFIIIKVIAMSAGEISNAVKKEISPKNSITLVTEIPKITFDDVSGCTELKASVNNDIAALKNPEILKAIGARMPKGLVLYGPPGTGKTMIAKAIAGTAGVPFINASGSDFVEMYVGVGAKRIRELYDLARKNAPCIVFIDEIDAIGGKRGDSSNSERDQTINALLNELDGFEGTEGILTVCATNRLEMLDSALVRPGRFDKQLAVPLPDKTDRFAILMKHSEKKKMAAGVNLMDLAKKTIGFSGAYLEGLLNESAMIAITEGKTEIDTECIDKAFFRIVMKGDRKKGDRNSEENKLVAWHEAGHALATKLLTDDEVSSVTIIGSTSGAGGVTFINPKERILYNKKEIKNNVKVYFAGRAAEHIFLGNDDEITTGASNDIKQASYLLRDYIEVYGMGNSGMIYAKAFNVETSTFDEASEMANALYAEVLALLEENKETLEFIANLLLDKETVEENELNKIIEDAQEKK